MKGAGKIRAIVSENHFAVIAGESKAISRGRNCFVADASSKEPMLAIWDAIARPAR